mmetsp:Transcript_11760/g.21548  ORF Transcript_11760/g.21548 Transcript_11760/m.21548 type:complete len:101 (+) Transcript_11760:187-489(+)
MNVDVVGLVSLQIRLNVQIVNPIVNVIRTTKNKIYRPILLSPSCNPFCKCRCGSDEAACAGAVARLVGSPLSRDGLRRRKVQERLSKFVFLCFHFANTRL